jgi:hypothetical protein
MMPVRHKSRGEGEFVYECSVLAGTIVNHAAMIIRKRNAAMLQRYERVIETDVIPRSSPDVEIGPVNEKLLALQGSGKRQKSGSHVASDTNGFNRLATGISFAVQQSRLLYGK